MTAMQLGQPAGKIEIPAGASLTSSATVTEVHSFFPGEAPDEDLTVDGVDHAYQTAQSYRDTVSFFDRALTNPGFHVSTRATTDRGTVWSVRCPGGEHGHILVRDTKPTTFEIVVANRQVSYAPQAPGR